MHVNILINVKVLCILRLGETAVWWVTRIYTLGIDASTLNLQSKTWKVDMELRSIFSIFFLQ